MSDDDVTLTQDEVKKMTLALLDAKMCIQEQLEEKAKLNLQISEMGDHAARLRVCLLRYGR